MSLIAAPAHKPLGLLQRRSQRLGRSKPDLSYQSLGPAEILSIREIVRLHLDRDTHSFRIGLVDNGDKPTGDLEQRLADRFVLLRD